MDPTFPNLIAPYSPETQQLAAQARELIMTNFPNLVEQIDFPAHLAGYGTGPGYKKLVYTLVLEKAYINIGIYRATELPDPHNLLQGSGKVHCHVRIHTAADLEHPGLMDLLRERYRRMKEEL
jgi:hypothetical protein